MSQHNFFRQFLRPAFLVLAAGMGILLTSCSPTLKSYERVYVNDPEMQMGGHGEGFDQYVHSIREGSVAAQAQKGSGGCGCN